MGCNCKTNEKILNFYKKNGYQARLNVGDKLNFSLQEFIKTILIAILSLIFFPIIFVVLIVRFFMGKRTINLNKILNFLLKRNKK